MNSTKVDRTDHLLLRIAASDDTSAFRQLFYDFFAPLCVFAGRYLENKETCEDVVQEVFYRIWKNRKQLHIQTSGRNFLLTAVRNHCLDIVRHQSAERMYAEQTLQDNQEAYMPDLYTTAELEHLLDAALAKLPEPVASTFRQNRFEGLTYQEIADRRGISVKTVEAYMTKALKLLRQELHDYLPFFAALLIG